MRKPIIAGNWKMNKTPAEGVELAQAIAAGAKDARCDVVVCPPFVCLPAVVEALKGTNVKVGAQNMHFEASGAFTGEISADMLKAIGVQYVIIGHSERRQYFAETDETVNKKALVALKNGLTPIICVGESLDQREAGETDALISAQTVKALNGMSEADVLRCVVAYEPIWAIGTGKTATDAQANEAVGVIRAAVRKAFGDNAADGLRIQYGGSMNAANADGLMSQGEIDGGLIGGASLKAPDFLTIIAAADKSIG